jgi:hypothetical protein
MTASASTIIWWPLELELHEATEVTPNYTPATGNDQGGVYYGHYVPFTNGASGETYLWDFLVPPTALVTQDWRVRFSGVLHAAAGATTETILYNHGIGTYASAAAAGAVPTLSGNLSVQAGSTSANRWLHWNTTISASTVTSGDTGVYRLKRNGGTYAQVFRLTNVMLLIPLRGGTP